MQVANCCVNGIGADAWVSVLQEIEDKIDSLNFDPYIVDACVEKGCPAISIPLCELWHRKAFFHSPRFWSMKSMERWLNGYEEVLKMHESGGG